MNKIETLNVVDEWCVYILMLDETAMYVGSNCDGGNVYNRVGKNIVRWRGEFDFTKIMLLPVENQQECRTREKFFIENLRPPLNILWTRRKWTRSAAEKNEMLQAIRGGLRPETLHKSRRRKS